MNACSFAGCGRLRSAHGLCDSHDAQRRKGHALHEIGLRFKPRPLKPHPDDPGARLVPLTHGKYAVVDASDADAVGALNWSWKRPARAKAEYAVTNLGTGPDRRWCSLHRFLWERWGRPPTPQIDHENTDGLDCRSKNLRPATSSQNRCNTGLRKDTASGVKGVCWKKPMKKWHAQIGMNGKVIHLGYFDDITVAATAVAEARARLHAEYARAA